MTRPTRTQAGWLFFLIAAVSVPLVHALGGGRLVWVAALPAALSGAMTAWGKLTEQAAETGKSPEELERELAAMMLAQAQTMRARLLSTDGPADTAANVAFVRGEGRFREVGGERWGDMDSVAEYYGALHPGRMVILGDPGSGKTVLALELLTRLLEQRGEAPGERLPPVPIWLSATSWKAGLGVDEWLTRQLVQRFRMNPAVAAGLVRERRILPIVDGLDEMDPGGEPASRAQAAVEQLNAYMAGRERAAMVVTCRRAEYRMLAPGLDRATHVEITPLAGAESARYLRAQLYDRTDLKAWAPVLDLLERDPDGLLASQLATPWRLTLATTVYRHGGKPAELLPPERPDEEAARRYARRVNDLLLSRYVPAAVRAHPSDGRYRPDEVERWLAVIAAHLDWQARHGMSSTDIVLYRWWRISGNHGVRALHVAIAAIPVLCTAVVSTDLTTFASLALVVGGIALFGIRAPRPKHLSFHRLRTRHGLSQAATGFATGFALGFFFWFVFSIAFAITEDSYEFDLVFDALAVFAFGTLLGVPFGLMAGLSDPSPQPFGPRGLLRAEKRYGIVSAVLICAYAALVAATIMLIVGLAGEIALDPSGFTSSYPGYVVFNITIAVVGFGLPIGLAYGLAIGARAWVRYGIGIALAAWRGRLPWRFGAFLDWAYRAGLLRVSGTAYQFRHRQLQSWFTAGR